MLEGCVMKFGIVHLPFFWNLALRTGVTLTVAPFLATSGIPSLHHVCGTQQWRFEKGSGTTPFASMQFPAWSLAPAF